MPYFPTWKNYKQFEEAVISRFRHVLDDWRDFRKALWETAREEAYPAGSRFWRAQKGCEWSQRFENGVPVVDEWEKPVRDPLAYKPERMKPRPEFAREGRANPKGIPFLYLATTRDTAIAELRPAIDSYVSVGLFQALRDLRLVDCITKDDLRLIWDKEEPDQKERRKAVWMDIDEAFSRPVEPDDDTATYAPTQVIAEFFKADKYDGILYRSARGLGENLVLFDMKAVELTECHVCKVQGIKYRYFKVPARSKPANGHGPSCQEQTLGAKLWGLYEGKCAITGSDLMQDFFLFASNLTYIWPRATSRLDDPGNGLLLRADIMDLFDAGLIGIDPDTMRIHISAELRETTYNDLDGRQLRRRSGGGHPSKEFLEERWKWWKSMEKKRENSGYA